MFWNKKKAAPALQVAEPQELTGIEKAALEEREKERAELERKDREERQKMSARLIELRNQIKPQMDEINRLERRLNPGQYFAQGALQAQLAASYGGSGGLADIYGILGRLAGQIGRY